MNRLTIIESEGDRRRVLICIGAFILYAYWRCTTIIYESVIVFPPHGVQLETHRGPFQRPIFVARRFIPAVYIQDIIINEALRRWNVRYYLALIVHSPKEKLELAVFFENTLPHFPVLLEVYRGIKCALYDDETS
ncbi:hypothetical protein DFH11DRAFT_1005067 [Phellopilus nigrolimitatus]|nr:hypothetical protein DFH11DRAFT_1005067 [Phellopilus nigrolimitatus]